LAAGGRRAGVIRSAREWGERRPTAAAAIFYGLLALVLYAPALIPGHTLSAADYLWSAAPWGADRPADIRPLGSNYELIDSAVQFQPWLEYTRERLPDAPLWNTNIGLGRPYLANAQSAIFSPFYLPAYVLPFWWSLGVIALLKVFAAAFGTYLLGRALGMRFGGALMAGLVFGFSLYMLAWISWPQTNVWVLLPWLFLLTDRVIRRPGPLNVAGLATVVAVHFFGGHPESNFHLLAATAVFFAFRLFVLRRAGELAGGLGRPLLGFGGGVVLGTALAALTLLPFLELLFRSGDVDARQSYYQLALPKKYLLGFTTYDYWGRATHLGVDAFAQERALYVGALPLVLAGAALAFRPTLMRVGIAVFAALILAIAIGVPPFPEIASRIPIVKTGNHLRVVVILMLCLALLAGWGLDELSERRIRRPGALLAAALALLVVPLLVLAARGDLSAGQLGSSLGIASGLSWPDPPADAGKLAALRMAALEVWLVFMGLAVLLLAARVRGRLAATAFVALALALVAADLFKAGMGATPAIATSDAKQPFNRDIEYLQSRRPNRFVGLNRAIGPSPLVPNMAMRWDLYDARSYDLPVERRYDKLWRRAVAKGGPTDTPTTGAQLSAAALPAFRLLSVTDVLQDPAEPPVRAPRLPLARDGRGLRVYSNPGALPRAGVVDAQRVVPGGDEQLSAVLDPSFDGLRTVVTPKALPGLRSAPGRGPAGSARIVTYEPERVVVEASARRPSELVLTDLHFPGWKVKLDGKEADLHRVNYLLRGTTLPAGSHRVEFRYEPLSWRVGWIVSLLALAALAALVVVGVRRRRV
ncbi:MAG TPA: YfhO family protein, partial [Thermoleophilaceae bacterium]|nr:YfhO family protein [Thermoleophilaceae bacterium]